MYLLCIYGGIPLELEISLNGLYVFLLINFSFTIIKSYVCRLSFQVVEVPEEFECGDSLPEVLTKDKTDSTGPLPPFVVANNNAQIDNPSSLTR